MFILAYWVWESS